MPSGRRLFGAGLKPLGGMQFGRRIRWRTLEHRSFGSFRELRLKHVDLLLQTFSICRPALHNGAGPLLNKLLDLEFYPDGVVNG